jgi:hypothetical protein
MSTNYKSLIIIAWILSIVNSVCIGIMAFHIRGLHEAERRLVPPREMSVSLDNWLPTDKPVVETRYDVVWYRPGLSNSIDGILAWASELSAIVAKEKP